jgi:hypothetical protein
VTLLTDLDAFFTDHRRCGDLDAGVDGPVVWIACECGASMAGRVELELGATRLWGSDYARVKCVTMPWRRSSGSQMPRQPMWSWTNSSKSGRILNSYAICAG